MFLVGSAPLLSASNCFAPGGWLEYSYQLGNGDRVGANRLLSVKRELAPGLSLEQLPVIDVILLSHNHFDHLDIPSLQAIAKRQPSHAPLILTGLANAHLLQKHDIGRIKEMEWGDSVEVSGERIYFLEAVHESGRFDYVED